MSLNQRIRTVLALAALLFVVLYFFFPRDEEKEPGTLRIGAGNDITGILLESIVDEAGETAQGDSLASAYLFADCCSNTAQWALQAEEIDLGFYCASAAMAMVNKVEDFELYAPIIMNSEVIARLPETAEMDVVGIPRKRAFLGSLVTQRYPETAEVREIDRTYLAYSLKLDEVDGAVFDVADAAAAAQEFSFLPLTDQPYISYCMVVRKSLIGTAAFQEFLACYNRAVERLNTTEEKIRLMEMDSDFWEMSALEFLPLSS